MSTIYNAGICAEIYNIPAPVAKTVREVEIEQLLRECLPFVLSAPQPTEKTNALIDRVTRIIG